MADRKLCSKSECECDSLGNVVQFPVRFEFFIGWWHCAHRLLQNRLANYHTDRGALQSFGRNSHTYADSDTLANINGLADANCHCQSNADCHSQADPDSKATANGQAAAHTGASPIARRPGGRTTA